VLAGLWWNSDTLMLDIFNWWKLVYFNLWTSETCSEQLGTVRVCRNFSKTEKYFTQYKD
jgi:hypothetical protein